MLQSYPPAAGGALGPACRWLDLTNPSADEIARVERQFGVTLPDLDALTRIDASSRLRAEGDVLYMSAPLLSGTDTDRWATAPVGFILTPAVCITVRFAELAAFDAVAARVGAAPDTLPAEVLTLLLEEIVDRSADHLERGADTVNDTSQAVFFASPKRRQLSKDMAALRDAMRMIGQVSDRIARVRYTFLSIGRLAGFVIDRCTPTVEPRLRQRLDAVRHDIASLDEFEASLSGRIQLLQDAAVGFIGIEQNDVVKVLTVVSIVGVPPVFIVGVYGMNFKNMPELSRHYGYPYALALCVISVVIPLLWFRWRDWI